MATAAATTKRAGSRSGPERFTVMMYAIAAFLAVLALLAWQFRATPTVHLRRMVVVRRVYETRVVETVMGSSRIGSSATQSVSSSGSAAPSPAAPATRSS